MGDVVVPALVFAGLIALAALVVVLFILRRYLLTRTLGAFDCSLRMDRAHVAGGWMLGVARYETDRLDWFRVFAVSPRPGRTLARSRLVVLDSRKAKRGEGYSVVPGAVIVRLGYGQSVLELAMSEPDYNGFAAWLESAPPAPPLFSP